MTIKRNVHGAWVIYATVNGYLFHRTYYFYTKREAVQLFRAEVREMEG